MVNDIFMDILSVKDWNKDSLNKILRRYRKKDGRMYRNDELVELYKDYPNKNKMIEERIRLKPTRTNSGVVVVTVLTKPYPCPGKCIFCPNDPKMPKSYISSEPGAQRALVSKFDPYAQVYNRLIALKKIGHNIEKVELIILGGSWSAYPEDYRIWFVSECFRAMNSITQNSNSYVEPRDCNFANYDSSLNKLEKEQSMNEQSYCRNVGLVVETRPDLITIDEAISIRRLGGTKVQIGIQSLDDDVLRANCIGRTKSDIANAFRILRLFGFKIHGHWMPNLYKSTKQKDIDGYKELWSKDFCPDELKIYPTSVVPNTPLLSLYDDKSYKPYTEEELVGVLVDNFSCTPRYCRLSRVIRDIPSNEIVAGNTRTNLRQIVESKVRSQDIRSREIRDKVVTLNDLEMEIIEYDTSIGKDYFLSYKTKHDDKICGFLRLCLPDIEISKNHPLDELKGSAIIREVHVYGTVLGLDNKSNGEAQHIGLGRRLIKKAEDIAKDNGYKRISVISAIGTREYYKKLGYNKDNLYMCKVISSS